MKKTLKKFLTLAALTAAFCFNTPTAKADWSFGIYTNTTEALFSIFGDDSAAYWIGENPDLYGIMPHQEMLNIQTPIPTLPHTGGGVSWLNPCTEDIRAYTGILPPDLYGFNMEGGADKDKPYTNGAGFGPDAMFGFRLKTPSAGERDVAEFFSIHLVGKSHGDMLVGPGSPPAVVPTEQQFFGMTGGMLFQTFNFDFTKPGFDGGTYAMVVETTSGDVFTATFKGLNPMQDLNQEALDRLDALSRQADKEWADLCHPSNLLEDLFTPKKNFINPRFGNDRDSISQSSPGSLEVVVENADTNAAYRVLSKTDLNDTTWIDGGAVGGTVENDELPVSISGGSPALFSTVYTIRTPSTNLNKEISGDFCAKIGYVSFTFTNGQTKAICNPFDQDTQQTVELITNPAVGMTMTFFSPSNSFKPTNNQTYTYSGSLWTNTYSPAAYGGANRHLYAGEGFLLHNNTGTNFTLTFAGQVPSTHLEKKIHPGDSYLVSSLVPRAGSIVDLGFPAVNGDRVWKYVETNNSWSEFTFTAGAWSPSIPSFALGESFRVAVSNEVTWVVPSVPTSYPWINVQLYNASISNYVWDDTQTIPVSAEATNYTDDWLLVKGAVGTFDIQTKTNVTGSWTSCASLTIYGSGVGAVKVPVYPAFATNGNQYFRMVDTNSVAYPNLPSIFSELDYVDATSFSFNAHVPQNGTFKVLSSDDLVTWSVAETFAMTNVVGFAGSVHAFTDIGVAPQTRYYRLVNTTGVNFSDEIIMYDCTVLEDSSVHWLTNTYNAVYGPVNEAIPLGAFTGCDTSLMYDGQLFFDVPDPENYENSGDISYKVGQGWCWGEDWDTYVPADEVNFNFGQTLQFYNNTGYALTYKQFIGRYQ